jgi:hypothetical protein
LGKNLSQYHLSTTNPTCIGLVSNLVFIFERMVTNHLDHGVAYPSLLYLR